MAKTITADKIADAHDMLEIDVKLYSGNYLSVFMHAGCSGHLQKQEESAKIVNI